MGQKKRTNDQAEFRKLLKSYTERLKATRYELRKGLEISLPTLTNFLNEKIPGLAIEPSNVISLYDELSKPKISKNNKLTKEEYEANQERKNLEKRGPDELLVAAGFLPISTKIIRVTEKRFGQIVQVAALLDDKLLSDEDLLEIVPDFISNISRRMQIRKPYADGLKLPDNYDYECTNEVINKIRFDLRTNSIYSLDFVLLLDKKLENLSKELISEGKDKLNNQEAIAIYRSILLKQVMQEKKTPLYIKVVKFDLQSISIDLKKIDTIIDFQDIIDDLDSALDELEKRLDYKPSLQAPVTRAIVTCEFGIKSDGGVRDLTSLTWSYTSGSTLLSNAISATALQIGYNQNKAACKVLTTTKALGSSPNSLIEATVILDENFQGYWVDRDIIKSVLQAFVEAGQYWIYSQIVPDEKSKDKVSIENEVQRYFCACKDLSKMRDKMNWVRESFNEIKFKDKDLIGKTILEIKKDSLIILKELSIQIPIYSRHRIEISRFYFIAVGLELRLNNIRGDLKNIFTLLEESEKEWEKIQLENNTDLVNELMPLRVLICADRLLHQLSLGKGKYLNEVMKDSDSFLLKQLEKILLNSSSNDLFKDLGADTYLAISEIHGNVARVIFYLSRSKHSLEKAKNYFLIASYYSMKIGSKQRTARWLALSGRTYIRLKQENKAKQLLELSKRLAIQGLGDNQEKELRIAILSEVEILEGEYLISLDDKCDHEKAIKHFILALKGAIYLGFARRIADSLYGISKCIFLVDIEKVNDYIETEAVFGALVNFHFERPNWLNKYNPTSSRISLVVLKFLTENFYGKKMDRQIIKNELLKLIMSIWQNWDDITTDNTQKKHPIMNSDFGEKMYH
jgi:hypothetical protein